jgi:hypothetical protein
VILDRGGAQVHVSLDIDIFTWFVSSPTMPPHSRQLRQRWGSKSSISVVTQSHLSSLADLPNRLSRTVGFLLLMRNQ